MATRKLSRPRAIGIALIMENEDGSISIFGSRDVDSFSVELMRPETEPFTFDATPTVALSATARQPPSFRVDAEGRNMHSQRAYPAPMPHQIEQRGIYLPDMSFRALPGSDES